MFVDHSVMSAMITDEAAARDYARRLQASTVRLTSPMAVVRAAVDVAHHLEMPLTEAGEAVKTFLQLMNIQSVAVPPAAAYAALEAQAAFAGLDPDDCMTYACARYYRQPLLFAGSRFAATDIAVA